jgi:hypothetical protein
MAMKPWYKVVTPREDLRSGKPLDASEFAVHLQHVRDGRAAAVYQNPVEFFERTFLTKTLGDFTIQVLRRLSGIKLETSAVFDLSTQFGGGKTHALTVAYHLAQHGEAAKAWKGVDSLLAEAGLSRVPQADIAVFVGTEFDSFQGRGGDDGTPHRRTPWGEIAFQLGGAEALKLLAQHDAEGVSPGGDVIEKLLSTSRPTLILLDELMNYINRSRKSGLAGQFYTFLHNLSEVARSRDNVVLAVSIPASELEMTVEDHEDFKRLKKLLDRLGKAIVMSAETETSEIIRRRLFEWGGLPKDAIATIDEYAEWIVQNKKQLPDWFPTDDAREALKACYPFHPSVLSVFERKWRGLPQFQQTRGMLRLLALWVSHAYSDDHQKALKDPLISLGSAPLEGALFRTAVFDQLGEERLEAAVTTDIAGKEHAHALRLDAEGTPEVKKARLHRKIATAVFFESNGGQQRGEASLPDVRMAVAEPDLNIGNVEQCLEALAETCYFLNAEKNKYRFSFQPNLNKLLADRRASVSAAAIEDRVRAEVQKVFAAGSALDRKYFPRKSNEVPDVAALTLVVLSPDQVVSDPATKAAIAAMTAESGASSRTFKSALLWAVAEQSTSLNEDARKLLAWKEIAGESGELKLEEPQLSQLTESVKKAERDLRETVWRSYKNIFLLGTDGQLCHIDLGLVHSDGNYVDFVIRRLKQDDIVSDSVTPNFLARCWPPALPEWSTKSVRDMFYASPKFPRLLRAEVVKDTISRGLEHGLIAYVGKASDGTYLPFVYKTSLASAQIDISDDLFIITKEAADEYVARGSTPASPPSTVGHPPAARAGEPTSASVSATGTSRSHPDSTPPPSSEIEGFTWTGEVSPQKWMNFYTKVLSRFATAGGLRLTVTVDVAPPGGTSATKAEETKVALRELGLDETMTIKGPKPR